MNTVASRQPTIDPAERRDHGRRTIARDSTVRDRSGQPFDVLVRDLSTHGFAIDTDRTLAIGETITLGLPGLGRAQALVMRRDGQGYGCRLFVPLAVSALATAFSGSPVATFRTTAMPDPATAPLSDPVVDRWPATVRLSILLGTTTALWAAIFRLL